jgi:RND family efflux transporter MFP subunit
VVLVLTAGQAHAQQGGRPHLVEVVMVEDTPLSFETVRTGTLSARRSVRIFNQEEGRIAAISVREGDWVRGGAVIVELDHKLLLAELSKATATRQEAEANLARVKELSRRNISTQERLEKAELAVSVAKAEEALIRTRLAYARIQAPFDGMVTERLIEPGDIAPRYTHLLTVIDPTSLYTKVSVSELMLPRLQVGDPVEVRVDALSGRADQAYPGRVGRIHPVVDPRTRQGVVEVEFDQVPEGAVSGQLCRVRLSTPESRRLVMPFAALRRDQEGEFAFAVENGKAVVKRVRTGLRLEQRIEILDGLAPGDRVVVRGFLDLSPGKAVSIVAPPPGPSAEGEKQGMVQ